MHNELEIIGQDEVIARFRRILRRDRLASTYLFVGPGGVGKRTFALELAKALLCQRNEPAMLAPCGECESCRLASAGNHPDILEVAQRPDRSQLILEQFVGPKENRHHEGLCHDLALRPSIGTRRIAIIDDADSFSTEVANALLKTLEEPPPRSLLILIGTSLAKQLPTIRSRAQVVPFARLEEEVIARWLLEWQWVDSEESALRIARVSGGSLDKVRTLLIPSLWDAHEAVINALARPVVDSVTMAEQMHRFTQEAGKEAGPKRQAALALLGLVVGHLRLRLAEQPEAPEAAVWLDSIERSLEAEHQIVRNVNLQNVLQCWADDLARLRA